MEKCKSIPSWDMWFMEQAQVVSKRSKDPSTKTGAVVVRPDHTIVSMGYNGFPKVMPDVMKWYLDRTEKYSRIVHCEVNALIFAREPLIECTLYTWPFLSCDRCCVQMLQAGITRFVAPKPSHDSLLRWGAAFNRTKQYCYECGAEVTELEQVT
jgi:dCMP deaminase